MSGLGLKTGLNKKDSGFALPTVLVLSLVLLIIGLSVFQVGASISRALADQQWNRMAKEAAQAGVNYASSCLRKDPASPWAAVLKPNTDCTGTSLGAGVSQYYASDTSTSTANKWQSTFVVSTLSTGSYGEPRAKVTGTLELLAVGGVSVTKTYTSETSVILNIQQNDPFEGAQVGSSGYCTLRSDDQVYCQNVAGAPDNPTKFELPTGYKAVDFRLLYDGRLTVTGVCVLAVESGTSRMHCAGENTNGQFGTGASSGTVPYPNPTASSTTFGSIEVAELWRGFNINSNICIIANNTSTYCSGDNSMGSFGNSNMTDSTVPVLSFNQAPLSTGGNKIQLMIGHITTGPESIPTHSLADNPLRVTSRRCAIGTDDQLYCAGVCSHSKGGLLFGTALAGSGTNACGRSPAPAPAYGVNPSPDDWGATLTAPPLVPARNNCYQGSPTDTAASCYYRPVKFQIPAGVLVRNVSIKFFPAKLSAGGIELGPSASSLCIYGSDNNIYCTINAASGTKTYEPADLTQ